MTLFCLLCLLACLVLAGCQEGGTGPAPIAPEDMCAYCKMAISEKRYAAQFLDKDGQPFKFDDIGCMVKFAGERHSRDEIAAYFVMDFDEREWVNAGEAYYVSSPALKTPMGGQATAFRDEAAAREAAARYRGRLVGFDDLLGPRD